MSTILDFCGECGMLLPAGLGLQEIPKCPNCGVPIKERKSRIQGEFDSYEAVRLRRTQGELD